MNIIIMKPAGINFPGVEYNDKKVDKGKGELMIMKNFPSFINQESSRDDVKSYLASISKNDKVKKPQFHAVLSTKFREHSKEEVAKVAEEFMNEMGYGNQPFIVVFHNDTENNHVHIVSTRVDKSSGKKINDSFEKLKSQKALARVMEKLYEINVEEQIKKILDYKYSSVKQLELLMERGGFRLSKNKNNENALDILKNGASIKTIFENQLQFSSSQNNNRAKQLKAILSKYKDISSNKVFKVEDRRGQEAKLPEEKKNKEWKPKIEFESELQKKLRDAFGIDIIFHHKEGKTPFGYTLIDHKSETVYKGSEIIKMNDLFEFTSETMDKRIFESLKDYNIVNKTHREILLKHLKSHKPVNLPKDFMLFENKKRKNKNVYAEIRNDVKEYLRSQKNEDVKIIKSDDGNLYAIHERLHYVGEVKFLIGEKEFESLIVNNQKNESFSINNNKDQISDLSKSINEFVFELKKSSSNSSKDPGEEELKKRKKRKKR